MPKVYDLDATPEDVKKDKNRRPCSDLRDDLKECIEEADCVKVQRRKVKDCYESGELPIRCIQLRQILFDCKRSLLDNRLRFRGRKDY